MSWYFELKTIVDQFFLNVLPEPPDKTEKQRQNFPLGNIST